MSKRYWLEDDTLVRVLALQAPPVQVACRHCGRTMRFEHVTASGHTEGGIPNWELHLTCPRQPRNGLMALIRGTHDEVVLYSVRFGDLSAMPPSIVWR